MMQTKKLWGECQHCGGMIEFQADVVGTTADCPHCGQPTELMLALPPETGSSGRTKAIVFAVIMVVILLGGVGGAMLALKRAQLLAAQNQQVLAPVAVQTQAKPADPLAALGFRASPVSLDKGRGTSVVYAVGTIGNLANRQRFGVRVELDLFDPNGGKVGSATDYRSTLEPNEEWRFRALVVEKKAVSAKIASIEETP
jgi:hypothetical protein